MSREFSANTVVLLNTCPGPQQASKCGGQANIPFMCWQTSIQFQSGRNRTKSFDFYLIESPSISAVDVETSLSIDALYWYIDKNASDISLQTDGPLAWTTSSKAGSVRKHFYMPTTKQNCLNNVYAIRIELQYYNEDSKRGQETKKTSL